MAKRVIGGGSGGHRIAVNPNAGQRNASGSGIKGNGRRKQAVNTKAAFGITASGSGTNWVATTKANGAKANSLLGTGSAKPCPESVCDPRPGCEPGGKMGC